MTGASVQNALQAVLKGLSRFRNAYTASTLAFVAATARITDSAGGLGWLQAGDRVTVSGSVSNDGDYLVAAVAAGYVTITGGLVNESAGAAVTLTIPEIVTRGDYRPLDSGRAAICVILPGRITSNDAASYTIRRTWSIPFDLFHRYTDNGTSEQAFTTLLDEVIARLDTYPTLDNEAGVTLVEISTEGDPTDVFDKQGAGPFFMVQTLRATITERVNLSTGEYAT
jgi:hypothetical protein